MVQVKFERINEKGYENILAGICTASAIKYISDVMCFYFKDKDSYKVEERLLVEYKNGLHIEKTGVKINEFGTLKEVNEYVKKYDIEFVK